MKIQKIIHNFRLTLLKKFSGSRGALLAGCGAEPHGFAVGLVTLVTFQLIPVKNFALKNLAHLFNGHILYGIVVVYDYCQAVK